MKMFSNRAKFIDASNVKRKMQHFERFYLSLQAKRTYKKKEEGKKDTHKNPIKYDRKIMAGEMI
jgi:hypothetical protein